MRRTKKLTRKAMWKKHPKKIWMSERVEDISDLLIDSFLAFCKQLIKFVRDGSHPHPKDKH